MEEINCSICYDKLSPLKNIVVTECDHTFHFTCIFKNIKTNYNSGDQCPLCRKNFDTSHTHTTDNIVRNTDNLNYFLPNTHLLFQQHRLNRIRRQLQYTNSPNLTTQQQILRQEIREDVQSLDFKTLKNKLKEHGVSSRGYVRVNLEKRLFNKLLSERNSNVRVV